MVRTAAVFLAVGLVLLGAIQAEAQEGLSFEVVTGPQYQVGFSFPAFGWVTLRDDGRVDRVSGFNVALGLSYRKYPQGLTPGRFNFFWGYGTLAVVLPYIEAGGTFPFALNEAGTQTVNVDVGVVYVVPYVGVNVMF